MRILSATAHGALDYLLAIALGMAPLAFALMGGYATVCYVLAGSFLVVALLTDSPMGATQLIPYRIHGGLDLVSGLVFIGSPFLFGFSAHNPTARAFFIAFGIVYLLLWLLTDWSGRVHSEMNDSPSENLAGRPEHL
ncbi:MAG: hypothetical protein H7Z21_08850 [Hymenobacter sp.]|nr:hypothetical protein [Hymenobacter sp.]